MHTHFSFMRMMIECISRPQVLIVLAVSLGGMIGGIIRYSIGLYWPTHPDHFPWSTMVINLTGCAAMGMVMVIAQQYWAQQWRFLQPFLGTGVLGGYTTFSTFTAESYRLILAGHSIWSGLYMISTAGTAVLAAGVGEHLTRRVMQRNLL